MKDEQLIEIVATDVMGWEITVCLDDAETWPCLWKDMSLRSAAYWFVTDDDWDVWQDDTRAWNPLRNDNDCMAAWDKAGEIFTDGPMWLTRYHECWDATINPDTPTKRAWASDPDRRRAMVECMAKAVTQ